MPLEREVYKELESVVGPEHITEEPATLFSYAYQWMAELVPDVSGGGKFFDRPEAVLVPGGVEEVQAIVRLCNRYGLKFHVYSTGWGPWAAPPSGGQILLDLRRMNRILEIDEQNMFAVVEPYVVAAQLQAEAMKRGLNVHISGAGAGTSVLANACCFQGGGPDCIYFDSPQNSILSIEWVMPTGDILRTGSLGSGLGWFCAEGPGPSTQGIIRGALGGSGGWGVVTKIAIRLVHWPGPPVMPIEGTVPAYRTKLPADQFRATFPAFPSWQSFADAIYHIYDSEIGYIAHRQYVMWGDELQAAFLKIVSDPDRQLCDLEELLHMPEIQKLTDEMRRCFQLILVGMTPRDLEYQLKVLDRILEQTGGWNVALVNEPAMQQYVLLYMMRLCFKNLNFTATGGFIDTYNSVASPDIWASGEIEAGKKLLKKYAGRIADAGDQAMGPIAGQGGGGVTGWEDFLFYDPHDPDSVQAAIEVSDEGDRLKAQQGRPPGGMLLGLARTTHTEEKVRAQKLVHAREYQWQRKLKQIFDPNGIGSGNYLWAAEPSTNGEST
ncbi:MAG: FAD-binding oxidoreductase [Desulfobacterota bacterium]|nr:FAD-binding oxidoreductase [Thermodesulfobacteriota bacterium]